MASALLNVFPRWKYALICLIMVLGLVYAMPNLYGEDPAIQISPKVNAQLPETVVESIQARLNEASIRFKQISAGEGDSVLVRFFDTDTQLKAKEVVKAAVGSDATVALNLAPVTPYWLSALGATPLKLGLDLRGGVHFLLEVDVESAVQRRQESIVGDLKQILRDNRIRYTAFRDHKAAGLQVAFKDRETREAALSAITKSRQFNDMEFEREVEGGTYFLTAKVASTAIHDIRNYTVEQTLSTLRNRIDELGVAEPVVQRQGLNRVVVELPGVQDTARAKEILGKTATLQFHMQDEKGDVEKAVKSGRAPANSKLVHTRDGIPVLLQKRVILTGDSITGATTGFDQDSRPAVNIRLGGGGLSLFTKTTRENIGKQMGVLYIETRVDTVMENGEPRKVKTTEEKLVSLATIQSALGNQFQITGLNMAEAQNLALILRAGALPATVSIVEERTIGPSMGKDNIDRGILSIQVGMMLVLIFMIIYYSLFGLIANIALVANLILLVAALSFMGATLTLPGIAGIVLTLGMAVDANVLIFERIREELRGGMSTQASIHRGFDRAFATIVDANVTTLIVAIILFSVGSGPVKGFAVTLSVGILTSMFTAVTVSRALVNLTYGGKQNCQLRLGV